MALIGANLSAKPASENLLITRTNYLIGNNPARWRTDIPNYGRVRYQSVYDGIDVIYYGNEGRLEHDFIVAPNADPSKIVVGVIGTEMLRIDTATGDLILKDGQSTLRLLRPVTYQEARQAGGKRVEIASSYKRIAGNKIGFTIGKYNHSQPLIIDPVLIYSTYLGGSNKEYFGYYRGDQGNSITVDAQGHAYIVGSANSLDFPVTAGVYQRTNKAGLADGGDNVFVSELDSTGTALVFSTYLGGSGEYAGGYNGDSGQAVALDAEGNIYIAGNTSSPDFPATKGAFQTTNTNIYNNGTIFTAQTGFVAKLNPKGSSLLYSTYLGGASINNSPASQNVSGIAVDASGSAYVTGGTNSPSFPVTSGTYQANFAGSEKGAENAFVSKLNPSGTALVYSTYLGGSGVQSASFGAAGDSGNGIAVDGTGNTYVTGRASSVDFPVTSGAAQTKNQGAANTNSNAFLSKLNPSGTQLVYSTYLGGSGYAASQATQGDFASSIAIDSDGNAYVGGTTISADFPTVGGLGLPSPISGSSSGFVAKVNATGTALVYSTLLGGTYSNVNALAIDNQGEAFAAGSAVMGYFPETTDALAHSQSGLSTTAFIAKLNPAADALEFASLLGGSYYDSALGLALNSTGDAFITGVTESTDFPVTSGALQSMNHSPVNGSNAFVSGFDLAGETTDQYAVRVVTSSSAASISQGTSITLTAKVLPASTATTNIPTGSVTFGGLPTSPVVALDDTGTATWTSSTLEPGLYQAFASYSGNTHYLSSSLPNQVATFRVIGPPAQLLNGTGFTYQYTYGEFSNLAITVLVTDASGEPLPGVTVNFAGSQLSLSSTKAVSDVNGLATVNFTALAAGTLTLTASVSGVPTALRIPIYVSPAPLTVSLNSSYRIYGAANPTFSYTIAGIVNGDTVTVTPSTSATTASPVNTYPITATVSGTAASNYVITVKDNVFRIVPATLIVSAAPATQGSFYGSPIVLSNAFTITGFVNGDTEAGAVTGAPAESTIATPTSPAGFYSINLALGTLASTNYVFQFRGGRYYIYSVPLTLTATSFSIAPGQPIPALTYTLSGFVHGDTAAVVTGAPNLTTTATSNSQPGKYTIAITPGSLSAQNYRFNPVNGVLTIALPSGALTFSPSVLTFPPTVLNTSSSQVLTVSNTSSSAATVSSYALRGTNASEFAMTAGTCTLSLPAKSSCTITITFRPTNASATATSLVVTDTAMDSPQAVPLTGTVAAQPTISFSPNSISFPEMRVGATSPVEVLTVTNTSSSPMSVSSYTFAGTNASEFLISNKNCVASLSAGASCSVSIAFRPTTAGGASALIAATDNAIGSPQSVPITGSAY